MGVYGADQRHHTLTVLVENKSGVLARVAGLFSRRGYNIFSLAVAPSDDVRFSRITIVVDVESAPLDQIIKQLDKLIPVVSITELDPAVSANASCCWPRWRPVPTPGPGDPAGRVFEGRSSTSDLTA